QVWASVNEADIGQVWSGQQVRFSVDTYPGQEFVGKVAEDQPRLNASMTSNVVTYTVVVDIDNSDMKFKPYLTANMKFVQEQKASALLIPNGALRWRPQPEQVLPEHREEYLKHARKRRPQDKAPELGGNERFVFVPDNGFVRPVRITIGRTDGTVTEILAGDLKENDEVVEGEGRQDGGGAGNPFTPNVFGA